MTPQIARKVISAFQQSPSSTADQPDLTDKERQVLAYLAEGKSYKMIADAMNLSVHSIRYYLRSIYEKLQVSSRAEAVAKGLKQRL
ncbi:MAG: response regulator transcription factor, partial [Calditrichaeota bacterium]|nr:response regulator transcription factor [Calditrichota bacterium]